MFFSWKNIFWWKLNINTLTFLILFGLLRLCEEFVRRLQSAEWLCIGSYHCMYWIPCRLILIYSGLDASCLLTSIHLVAIRCFPVVLGPKGQISGIFFFILFVFRFSFWAGARKKIFSLGESFPFPVSFRQERKEKYISLYWGGL